MSHKDYPDCSIYEFINDTAKKYPGYDAYEYFKVKVSFKEFIKQINDCAKALKVLGVNENDTVSICLPNVPEAIISFYAINLIGGIANMIHPLSSEEEIKNCLTISNSKTIIALDMCYKNIENIIIDTKIENIVLVSVGDSMDMISSKLYWLTKGRKIKHPRNELITYWNDFIKKGTKYIGDYEISRKGSDPAVILYSGGTTGKSKGILHSNLSFNAMAIGSIFMCEDVNPGDAALSIMPVFHGFGLGVCIHTILWAGAKCILVPQFDMRKFDDLLKNYKPNFLVGVPTLYEALLRNNRMDGIDLSFLKCAISGGDSLSIDLKKRLDKFLKEHNSKIQIREGYGATECLAGVCLTPKNKYKEGSIGLPYPDTYFKIVTPNTQDELPNDSVGEICISGPTVMMEYINEPKETALTLQLHEDNRIWLNTGDLGSIDKDGFVYFKQRLKRMIISCGYSIYPQTIESVIDKYPSVDYSTVIGVKDEYKGQKVKAFIVLKKGIMPTEELKQDILKHCEKSIAKYAIPKEIEFKASIPKTSIGKIAYYELNK